MRLYILIYLPPWTIWCHGYMVRMEFSVFLYRWPHCLWHCLPEIWKYTSCPSRPRLFSDRGSGKGVPYDNSLRYRPVCPTSCLPCVLPHNHEGLNRARSVAADRQVHNRSLQLEWSKHWYDDNPPDRTLEIQSTDSPASGVYQIPRSLSWCSKTTLNW